MNNQCMQATFINIYTLSKHVLVVHAYFLFLEPDYLVVILNTSTLAFTIGFAD